MTMLDLSHLSVNPWYYTDSVVMDTSRLQLYYQLSLVPDTVTCERHTTMMVTEIGGQYIQYYSLCQLFRNRISTRFENQIKDMSVMEGVYAKYEYNEAELRLKEIAGEPDYVNSEIWVDLRRRTLTERASDYQTDNLAREYEEVNPGFEWAISDTTDTICNYVCIRASCKFRGREWQVWFAPEIPISCGPWKFNGLPGLILKAEDAQAHYTWICTGIEKTQEPMVRYVVPTRTLSKAQFDRWMRYVHTSPYEALGGGTGAMSISAYFQDTDSIRELDDKWTLPYNPIELE